MFLDILQEASHSPNLKKIGFDEDDFSIQMAESIRLFNL